MSLVSPIAGSYPVIGVMYGLVSGETADSAAWLAIAAVICGILIVASCGPGHEAKGHVSAGKLPQVIGLSALAALLFATSLIAGQAVTPIAGESAATWAARGFALITLLPLFFFRSMRSALPVKWWPALVLMGALDTIAMLAIYAAGNLTFPELAIVLGGSFGAVVTVLAWLTLREPVSPAQWLGIALITGGAGLLSAGA